MLHPRVRLLVVLLLIVPLACLSGCGCRPAYQTRPWTLAYQHGDAGLRLPTIIPMSGPFFSRSLQPEGAAPSPTGAHLLMATAQGELWLYDVLRSISVLLAPGDVKAQFWPDVSPWSADGQAVVYVRQGDLIYRHLGQEPRVLTTTGDVFTAAISPDGTQIAFGRLDAKQQDQGLWVVPVSGGEPKQLVAPTADVFHACCPHWSPDGRWIAFLQAFEGGALGVVAADGGDVRLAIDAAWEPIKWLPDSQTILFPKVVYEGPADGIQRYDITAEKVTALTAAGRHATFALSPDAAQALVASWRETSEGKVTEGALGIVDVVTGSAVGSPTKLAGSAASCHWAPDGRQLAVLVDLPDGKEAFLYSRDGLPGLQPQTTDVSSIIGWVRLWAPPPPRWQFWRR